MSIALTPHNVLLDFEDHCDDADDKSSFEATRKPVMGIITSVSEAPPVSEVSSGGSNQA